MNSVDIFNAHAAWLVRRPNVIVREPADEADCGYLAEVEALRDMIADAAATLRASPAERLRVFGELAGRVGFVCGLAEERRAHLADAPSEPPTRWVSKIDDPVQHDCVLLLVANEVYLGLASEFAVQDGQDPPSDAGRWAWIQRTRREFERHWEMARARIAAQRNVREGRACTASMARTRAATKS